MKVAGQAWVLGLAVVVGVGAACADAPADASQDRRPAVERAAASSTAAAAESEVVYVDVRTPEEYAAGHVEGAIHIPHTEMARRYGELARFEDREIVVYCRTGRRSGIAQGILGRQGFDNVTNGGGLRDLRARGVPTTR